MSITIRRIKDADPEVISNAFSSQGWDKPAGLYRRYFKEQEEGLRVCLIAEVDGTFAGYTNVLWESYHHDFKAKGIPEINDFTVLIKYCQRRKFFDPFRRRYLTHLSRRIR